MLDYHLLETLAQVAQHQSFHAAARKLHISQSAVSQRLKTLEEQLGSLVLVRELPMRLTALGHKLVQHVKQVQLMESDLQRTSRPTEKPEFLPISIGVNADSLATWYLDAMAPVIKDHGLLLELTVEDQDLTLELLRKGEVIGCIGSTPKPLPGCDAIRIGKVRYLCVAAPGFIRRYFPKKVNRELVMQAPALRFSHKDEMHDQYLKTVLGRGPFRFPTHFIPSTECFLKAIINEIGYGLVPEQQMKEELKRGRLKEIIPNSALDITLYWHWYRLQSGTIAEISKKFISHASALLAEEYATH